MPVEFEKLTDEEKSEVISKVLEDETLFDSLIEKSKGTEKALFVKTAVESIVKDRLKNKEKELLETKETLGKTTQSLEELKQKKTEQKTSDQAQWEAQLEVEKKRSAELESKWKSEREARKQEFKMQYFTNTLLKVGAAPETLESALIVADVNLKNKVKVVDKEDGNWAIEAINEQTGKNEAEKYLSDWLDANKYFKKGLPSGANVDGAKGKVNVQNQNVPPNYSGARGMEAALNKDGSHLFPTATQKKATL